MTQTISQQLAEIRARSAEVWRIRNMPDVDPETGVPKPFIIVSQAQDDVKFLLERLDEAENQISELEDQLMSIQETEMMDERDLLDSDATDTDSEEGN